MQKARFSSSWLLVKLCLLSVLCLAVNQAYAFSIHYDSTRTDAIRACDQLLYVGQKGESTECYQTLLATSSGLEKADAAAALGDINQANRLYRNISSKSSDPVIKTHWAKLYLQTHQTSDAEALYREALLYDPEYLPARIGLAAAQSQGFEGQARQELFKITVEHSDNVHALVLLARIELELQNLPVARGLLNRALAEIESQNIPPLEIYALHAGANLLEGKSLKTWIDLALQYNPHYGNVYAIPARYYIITYRYREAVDLYQRAVAIDPDLATAHRDLGINQLRINNVFAARYHLQQAYDKDPFDVQIVNTLRLLDGIDNMRISSIDVPKADDPDTIIGRVLIRLDREDADALEPYVIDLSIKAVQLFSERYDFTLQSPMVVELYHDHDDFGVRTVSTPGIGLLGVTFGYLTAMDSPKARAAGDFHWGSTLWHEMAHVFTLEATDHLLPRWFSEGLSVYEEWNTGPLPNRELSMDVLGAIRAAQLLPIERLDEGFVRPSYNGQVQVSYMQAGLICDFIASRWGHEALVSMLKSFAAKVDTATALKTAIDMDASAFDQLFLEYLDTKYDVVLSSLEDLRAAEQQLERAILLDDWISTEALSRDLIRRYPDRVGAGNSYLTLADSYRQQGKEKDALETLLVWHQRGGHDPEVLSELVIALREAQRFDDAIPVMESINWVMPYHLDVHRWLGDHYLSINEAELAEREFNALLGLQQDSSAVAHLGKARAAMLNSDVETARKQVLYSLESAPFYRPAQQLLLRLSDGE
ncbi:tetratricopeptide repeat protein [Granulosicoccus sp.]|nr:tetratricopeptide repeat protein [Granulosicoccus sp.]MDB4223290.1 tetratricopeptide repeat protein [Granulosicoccus sp.]